MTRTFIVDASVVVKWLVTEPDSELAHRLINDNVSLCGPALVYAEVTNALWVKHRCGEISANDFSDAATILQNAPIAIPHSMRALAPAASRLARDLQHPVYDCFYLALAIQTQCPVVTADRAFTQKANQHPYLSSFLVGLDLDGQAN